MACIQNKSSNFLERYALFIDEKRARFCNITSPWVPSLLYSFHFIQRRRRILVIGDIYSLSRCKQGATALLIVVGSNVNLILMPPLLFAQQTDYHNDWVYINKRTKGTTYISQVQSSIISIESMAHTKGRISLKQNGMLCHNGWKQHSHYY